MDQLQFASADGDDGVAVEDTGLVIVNTEGPRGASIEAMAEIEKILGRLRSEEMNVDELAAQVRRASELIALCKERLHKAETEVGQILGAE